MGIDVPFDWPNIIGVCPACMEELPATLSLMAVFADGNTCQGTIIEAGPGEYSGYLACDDGGGIQGGAVICYLTGGVFKTYLGVPSWPYACFSYGADCNILAACIDEGGDVFLLLG